MTLRFAVVHEYDSDFTTATELADRVLCEAIDDWLKDSLADQREWVGTNPANQRLTWTGIKRSAERSHVKAHGHFGDSSGFADAISARRALEYLLLAFDGELDAVLLVRDRDNEPERKRGLEQARAEHENSRKRPEVVIGFAIPEREAWVLSGFEPQDDGERATLADERQILGFQPHEQSHRLTTCRDTEPHSPKRVLRQLSGGNYDRERHCWRVTSLDVLRDRGTENGLTAFLDEVKSRLAPLIGYVRGSTGS